MAPVDECDGTSSAVVDSKSCLISIDTLRQVPFSYDWGDSVYAKFTASNIVGTSEESEVGNGATILTNPDAPLNVVNNPSYTAATQIGLTWENGLADGGTPVIDYRVSYDQGSDGANWVPYATGI